MQLDSIWIGMSEEDHCRSGNPDCDFDNERELALVSELMRAIDSYKKREDIGLCPQCLRDTMLAVAALLHLEAARIGSKSTERPPPSAKKLGDALAKAARNALENVSSAKAVLVTSRSRN